MLSASSVDSSKDVSLVVPASELNDEGVRLDEFYHIHRPCPQYLNLCVCEIILYICWQNIVQPGINPRGDGYLVKERYSLEKLQTSLIVQQNRRHLLLITFTWP